MRKLLMFLMILVALSGFSVAANATLIRIGTATISGDGTYGLIYDDAASRVWLDFTRGSFANPATQAGQSAWASNLTMSNVTLSGYTTSADLLTGWYLPTIAEYQGLGLQVPNSSPFTPFSSWNGSGNGGAGINSGWEYWSSSPGTGTNFYTYNFGLDRTSQYSRSFNEYGMAVHTGTVTAAAPVPEPATMFLLGFGLIGMGVFVRRRFKK